MRCQRSTRPRSIERLEHRTLLTTFSPVLLGDFAPGVESSTFSNFQPAGDMLLFNVNGDQIWRTDATTDGTIQLGGGGQLTSEHVETLGLILFNVVTPNGPAIWRTDGTSDGTFEIVSDARIHQNPNLPRHDQSPLAEAPQFTLFNVEKAGDVSIYRTDGTSAGSFELIPNAQLRSSSEITLDEAGFGHVLPGASKFSTNGTVEGTELVTRLFTKPNGDGRDQLWATDDRGNEVDLGVANWSIQVASSVNDTLLILAFGAQLYHSDGTPEGTLDTGHVGAFSTWVGNRSGQAYFHSDDPVRVVSTDGTDARTIGFSDVGGLSFRSTGELLFFALDRSGPSNLSLITEDDGSVALASGYGSLSEVSSVNGISYSYVLDFPFVDYELRRLDSILISQSRDTPERLNFDFLDDRYLSSDGSGQPIDRLKPIDQPLFLLASGEQTTELWSLDGSVFPQVIGDVPLDLAWQYTSDGFLFSQSHPDFGQELWISNGSADGTTVIDFMEGTGSSNPEIVNWLGGTVVIAEGDGIGRELWSIESIDPLDVKTAAFYNITEGEDLVLGAIAEGQSGDVTFAWDLDNDGEFDDALGANPTVTWETLTAFDPPVDDGAHQLRVRVTNSTGDTAFANSSVMVRNLEPTDLTVELPSTLFTNEVLKFTVAATDVDSLQYSVDFGDGSVVTQSDATFTKAYDAIGIYSLRITVSDGDGGEITSSHELTVTHADSTLSWIFQPGHVFGGSDKSVDVDLADFNNDGALDLFETVQGGADRLWTNNGDGAFRWQSSRLADAAVGQSIYSALGHLNDDNRIDIVIASFDGLEVLTAVFNHIWNSGTELGDQNVKSYDVALGDLDSDGDLDVFVANYLIGNDAPAPDSVFLNLGDGSFVQTDQQLGNNESRSVELGDLDGDGDLDAVVAGLLPDSNHIWLNDGQGLFVESDQRLAPGGEHVAMGDLDNDGDLDLFTATSGPNFVWFNDGSGRFSDSAQRIGQANSSHVVLGDLDLDGDLDAVIANWEGDANEIWLNDGQGGFSDSGARLAPSISTEHIALADLDGDGDLDLVAASYGDVNHVYLNSILPPAILEGDLNGDMTVDFADFLILSANFGATNADRSMGDITGDGTIDFADFLILANDFGKRS